MPGIRLGVPSEQSEDALWSQNSQHVGEAGRWYTTPNKSFTVLENKCLGEKAEQAMELWDAGVVIKSGGQRWPR